MKLQTLALALRAAIMLAALAVAVAVFIVQFRHGHGFLGLVLAALILGVGSLFGEDQCRQARTPLASRAKGAADEKSIRLDQFQQHGHADPLRAERPEWVQSIYARAHKADPE